MKRQRIVVALSGGVDSSVAALLLKNSGHEVLGIFMKNWHDSTLTRNQTCPWLQDSRDAMLVAEKLAIPFQVVDLSTAYKEKVVDYMVAAYERGYTPNPDIRCNREIKFRVFLELAKQLGATYVATGHYCQKKTTHVGKKIVYSLHAGADKQKDQSYFLCQLNQNQLATALFPVGHLTKKEVRILAKEAGLVTAEKKDSQGLCFVGKISLPIFLQQRLREKAGEIVEISSKFQQRLLKKATDGWHNETTLGYNFTPDDGEVIGHHNGAHNFTVGQRRGLSVGGTHLPLYVIATNVVTNTVFVGRGKKHPALYRKALLVEAKEIHWIREDTAISIGQKATLYARIRYRQPLQRATLYRNAKGIMVVFDKPQMAIAAGQFIAWYKGNELVGSGTIAR